MSRMPVLFKGLSFHKPVALDEAGDRGSDAQASLQAPLLPLAA